MIKATILRRIVVFPMACALMLFANVSQAQNNFDLSVLNPGEIMVNLNANEQAQVEQDTLHANLYYAAQGRDRVALQDEVNRAMAAALEVFEGSDVEYSTQGYRVYQVQSGRPTRGDIDNPVWRAQQSIALSSMDSTAVLDLVAELQATGLTMGGLSYSLSPQREEEVADSLMAAALEKLQNRAENMAAVMGKGGVEIVEISMNSSNSGFFGRSTAMSLASSAEAVATPVAEPGMTTVMLNVSARAILLN